MVKFFKRSLSSRISSHYTVCHICGLLYLFLALPGLIAYGLHPDELGARVMDIVGWNQWTPTNYYYPTTHVYTIKTLVWPLVEFLHYKIRLIPNADIPTINIAGRLVSVAMGVGCCYLASAIAYAITRSQMAASIATILIATFPLLNNLGRFHTTDVPNLFWMLLAIQALLWSIAKTADVEHFTNLKRLFFAGLILGFAVGVKYFAAFLFPSAIFIIYAYHRANLKYAACGIFTYCIAASLGFVCSTPTILWNAPHFIGDLAYLSNAVPQWEGVDKPKGWFAIPSQLIQVHSPVVLLFAMVGIWHAFYHRLAKFWIFPILFITWYLFLGPKHFYPLRFVLPMHASVIIIAATGIYSLYCNASQRQKVLILILAIVAILDQTWRSSILTSNFHLETRRQAADFINQSDRQSQAVIIPISHSTYFPEADRPANLIIDPLFTDMTALTLPANFQNSLALVSSAYTPHAAPNYQAWIAQLPLDSNWTRIARFAPHALFGREAGPAEFLSPIIEVWQYRMHSE